MSNRKTNITVSVDPEDLQKLEDLWGDNNTSWMVRKAIAESVSRNRSIDGIRNRLGEARSRLASAEFEVDQLQRELAAAEKAEADEQQLKADKEMAKMLGMSLEEARKL